MKKGIPVLVGLVIIVGLVLTSGWAIAAPPPPAGVQPLDVVINEVAWAGHQGLTADEWIELYNNTDRDIDLTDWTLTAIDGTPTITLSGTIPAHGYYLLERSDDSTVSNILADQIYTGALGNNPGAETLELRDDNRVLPMK